MLTLSHIRHFVELHADIAYILITLGVIIEGEIVVVIAGIFANLGSLNVFIAFIATMVGGGVKSVLGYTLGYYLQNNHSGRPIVSQSERRVNYFLPRFSERPFWSISSSRVRTTLILPSSSIESVAVEKISSAWKRLLCVTSIFFLLKSDILFFYIFIFFVFPKLNNECDNLL